MRRNFAFFLFLKIFLWHSENLQAQDDQIPIFRLQGEEMTLQGSWMYFQEAFLSAQDLVHWRSFSHQTLTLPQSLPPLERDPSQPGWGTLIIRLDNLNKLGEDLGLMIRANSAYHIFLYDPQEKGPFYPILAVGRPASTAQASLPENVNRIGVIPKAQLASELWLVIHISGWHFHAASVWAIPKILPLVAANRYEDWTRFVETLTLGTLVTMALYFFSFTLRRKDDTSAFWLASLSVFTATRLILTSGSLLNLAMLTPSVSTHSLMRKLEFASIPALGFAGLIFVVQCFGATRFYRFVKYDGWAAVGICLICMLVPATHLIHLLYALDGYLVFQFMIGIYVSLSSIRTNTSATIAFTMGLTINLLTALHDIALGSGADWTTG